MAEDGDDIHWIDLSEFAYAERVVGRTNTTARENMLEHVFISEALQEAWFVREQPMEVLRSEVDAYGYDLTLRCNDVIRWIQLRSTVSHNKQPQTVSKQLVTLAGACVVQLRYRHNWKTHRVVFTYDVYGGEPTDPLPDPGNGPGKRGGKVRPDTVAILASQFQTLTGVAALLDWLFGPAPVIPPTRVPVGGYERLLEVSAHKESDGSEESALRDDT